ncbi:IspA Geranylgeranyl pyrophosphate synthase [Pyrenophora tritici-repentis]|uniref:geranylgeranyl diphosphate synthase n=2 Tax=Pyrenophora tritici-repentis TaxID=45151 RepID=A0A2W1I1P8_9PLEO|nr:geranylgeranyl pyrophosphate synthetase [Pyrenophora tritici-repentis Pt-1C-BFP]KAA8618533.1 Polyprenyl synthetase [Pyrenophora tritici-repentis]EDU48391.1 geranylgeranyl pyrophosphate synthetase [Pyrenophora tritici-repentis Pt-1C-BFP]KAF7449006.1 Polyprenyl synthetase [Pyrenophora tritici-repentis]KAF7571001.1 IspA, Geranylgeranyl pyrophosphate synthase [Pyrenophora tritici-repentis]KAG9384053.1 Polyprenyl synthetase [Pyrenophora tritici-repentis]
MPVSSPTHPFASPNAIPPRTSSTGIVSLNGNSVRHPSTSSVLRPLSETDWIAQSKKSKTSHSAEPLNAHLQDQTSQSHMSDRNQAMASDTGYSTPLSPPSDDPKGVGEDLIYGNGAAWTESKERILLGPYDYLYGHPGKDIRSQCIAAFNLWLKVPPERLEVITKVVGMLHTASLLVDDVEDSSVLRRGIPVAHAIFGTPQTINSANYVYFRALSLLLSMSNPKLIEIFTEELLNLHRGQGMDLYWRDSLTCPSEADYLEMVGNKTGGLFRLAIKLMQAESETDVDCAPLVSTIGLLFQILDDHLNLSPTSGYTTLKGLCEDLTEGKFSFPVIHAIRADPSNQILMNILKQKTTDEEVKRYALRYMESKGSFEYSRRVIEELRGKTDEHVRGIEGLLGPEGREGAEALRAMLARLVLK